MTPIFHDPKIINSLDIFETSIIRLLITNESDITMDILEEFSKLYPHLAALVIFSGGIIFGSGAIWSFLRYRHDKKKNELDSVKVVYDLRKNLSDKLILLIEKSVLYADIRDGKVQVGIIKNTLRQLNEQISLLRDDILSIEEQLSKLECREPRPISIDYIRPPKPRWRRNEDEH